MTFQLIRDSTKIKVGLAGQRGRKLKRVPMIYLRTPPQFIKTAELLLKIAEAGFLLVGNPEESNHFLYIDAIKAAE